MTIALAACAGPTPPRPIDLPPATDAGTHPVEPIPPPDAGSLDAAACVAPNVQIVLDRTASMHRRVDGTRPEDPAEGLVTSKWAIAVGAIELVTGALEGRVRFGLTLFPRNAGEGECVTLAERIEGVDPSNEDCEPAENVVPFGGDVAGAIDPSSTLLCGSTPIGAALETAEPVLEPSAPVEQALVLVSDGRDSCGTQRLALEAVDRLRERGVRTHVIAFDGTDHGIDAEFLNDVACAGETAPPDRCTAFRATDPGGAVLFLHASDRDSLVREFAGAATDECCDCDGIVDDLI